MLTVFEGVALAIQHIGSTAVEGLSAKPIIDIAINIQTLPIDDDILNQLARCGYKERVNRLGPEQAVYVKGTEEMETHILHIIPVGNPDWHNKIRFRDHLRNHPASRTLYEQIKQELSRQYITDRGSYTKGKEPFIRQVLSINPG
ncbi:GrpB family protein [Spirosoma agri]|uniref:GrpB family protein n=1 Tax=Spirosoma agri TaxID=1987381 RepID=A0A6M0IK95_9BACT|nr:GrpB family protein [Spirosoma agri]